MDSCGVTADTREDPERAECGPDTLYPALSNTFDTPIPFTRSSISFLEERDHILILRPENVETIWTFLFADAAENCLMRQTSVINIVRGIIQILKLH